MPPVAQVSNGCAIISLQGARCGAMGQWKAAYTEEMDFAQKMLAPQPGSLVYAGKKFIITRAFDDTIMAQAGKEGLVMQKARTVFVVGHFVEGQVMNSVSAKVATVVGQLAAAGC